MTCSSNSLFNTITISSQQGKLFCFFKKTRIIETILCSLKTLGFIYGFFFIFKKQLYGIILKHNDQKQPVIKNFII
jgi:ribosomal protein S8